MKLIKVKKTLLWIYVAAVAAGIVYAFCSGQKTKTPGEIIYAATGTR